MRHLDAIFTDSMTQGLIAQQILPFAYEFKRNVAMMCGMS
jgi:hypothetical protein